MALSPKQERFVAEYLLDLNATQAAIRAGYSRDTARSIGSENLTKPDIAAAVEKAMAERSIRTEITADKVLRELARIGFSDIRRAVKWHSQVNVATVDADADMEALAGEGALRFAVANQVELVSSGEIDDETAAAVAEISQSSTGALRIKMYDKRAALVDIGKHLGMFKERVELSGHIATEPLGLSELLGVLGQAAREGDAGVH
jgi:phage terminase small subunit